MMLAALILIVATISEAAGLLTLYLLVERVRVPPAVQRAFDRYRNFLLVPDERMILVNRVAPLVWFLGAFVALAHWDLRRSLSYQALGGVVKYGFVLALGELFLAYTEQGTALWATLILVASMLTLSFLISLQRRKRSEGQRRAVRPDILPFWSTNQFSARPSIHGDRNNGWLAILLWARPGSDKRMIVPSSKWWGWELDRPQAVVKNE